MTVTLSDVRAAAAALAGSIVATPCTLSRTLSELTGARVTIKFENLQFTASFKERGALVKLKNLTATAAQRGVIAASAGNHAQGVAYHAERHFGAKFLGVPDLEAGLDSDNLDVGRVDAPPHRGACR